MPYHVITPGVMEYMFKALKVGPNCVSCHVGNEQIPDLVLNGLHIHCYVRGGPHQERPSAGGAANTSSVSKVWQLMPIP